MKTYQYTKKTKIVLIGLEKIFRISTAIYGSNFTDIMVAKEFFRGYLSLPK